jgi:glycerol-3-phosphate O-acyltransferase
VTVDIDSQPKAVLLSLLKRHVLFIDQRDIASARWELAEDEAKKLFTKWGDLSNEASRLSDAAAGANWSPRASALYHDAAAKARRAQDAHDAARRRADRAWKALQAHFQKTVK